MQASEADAKKPKKPRGASLPQRNKIDRYIINSQKKLEIMRKINVDLKKIQKFQLLIPNNSGLSPVIPPDPATIKNWVNYSS